MKKTKPNLGTLGPRPFQKSPPLVGRPCHMAILHLPAPPTNSLPREVAETDGQAKPLAAEIQQMIRCIGDSKEKDAAVKERCDAVERPCFRRCTPRIHCRRRRWMTRIACTAWKRPQRRFLRCTEGAEIPGGIPRVYRATHIVPQYAVFLELRSSRTMRGIFGSGRIHEQMRKNPFGCRGKIDCVFAAVDEGCSKRLALH